METLVHILEFLDAKDALLFSMASFEYRELVLSNQKVFRDRVTIKNDGTTKTVQTTSFDGNAKVIKTREIAHAGKKGRKPIINDTWSHYGSLFFAGNTPNIFL